MTVSNLTAGYTSSYSLNLTSVEVNSTCFAIINCVRTSPVRQSYFKYFIVMYHVLVLPLGQGDDQTPAVARHSIVHRKGLPGVKRATETDLRRKNLCYKQMGRSLTYTNLLVQSVE